LQGSKPIERANLENRFSARELDSGKNMHQLLQIKRKADHPRFRFSHRDGPACFDSGEKISHQDMPKFAATPGANRVHALPISKDPAHKDQAPDVGRDDGRVSQAPNDFA
jgi:hypothetical protein